MNRWIKKAVVAIFPLCILTTGTAMASISNNEINLGGLTPTTSIEYMESIYGAPDRVETKYSDGQTMHVYHYGNSVEVNSFRKPTTAIVRISANNGWATPAGVTVGMDKSVITNIYGSPDFKYKGNSGETVYEYHDTHAVSSLSFGIKKNKISWISIGISA